MNARDVMTANVTVIAPDASILSAARLMIQKKISGLPVADAAGHLVGMITEGDFLRRSEIGTQRQRPRWLEFLMGPGKLADEFVHSSGRKVEEVMTTDVKTVFDDTPLDDVAATMEQHRIKRVPVLKDGKIVGIITRANLLRAFVGLARSTSPSSTSDAGIHERLQSELKAQAWGPLSTVQVAVKDGVVVYSGCILDERQRQALRVIAENCPGVKKVEDHTVWVEPMSGMVIESDEDRAAARR